MIPIIRPMVGVGSLPMVVTGDPSVAIGEAADSMGPLGFLSQGHHLIRPLRHRHAAFHRISGDDNICHHMECFEQEPSRP
jgi:hypothetical protein